MKDYMKLLGLEAEDRVTGFAGYITSIAFDLYGCVQFVIAPGLDKDGKIKDAHWFDAKRVKVTGKKPVMKVPDFCGMEAGEEIGCEAKPATSSRA